MRAEKDQTPSPRAESARLLRHARAMRSDMPPAERAFWLAVRAHRFYGLGFRRQVPIAGFIVDFVCHERRLIVELDGDSHGNRKRADRRRTAILEEEGYRLLRYWNDEVTGNLPGVLFRLAETLGIGGPPPNPPPPVPAIAGMGLLDDQSGQQPALVGGRADVAAAKTLVANPGRRSAREQAPTPGTPSPLVGEGGEGGRAALAARAPRGGTR